VLTRIFGWRHFDLVEDMVQATLMDALESWSVRGVPDNPSGWVHRIAKNKILDALRRDQIGQRSWASGPPLDLLTKSDSTNSFSTRRSRTANCG
jgi:predicted RNA polymerase sigma factor